MKKYISYLFIGALALTSLVSCQERFESVPSVKTHRVYFSSNEEVTKTGITVEDGVVTPDWRATKAANVHLFEVGSGEGFSYGTDVEINLSSDNRIAHFMADFPVEMEIIVNPGGEGDGAKGGAKGTSTGPYTYSAVIAQKLADSYTFKVPSTQYPDAETLIDPDADFLIGYSRDSYDDPHNYDETVVDLYFDRPVALSRLAISNFAVEGELVKSVVINSENSIAGFVSYTDIDFKNAKVNFTPEEGPGILTLSYDKVAVPSDGTFNAYFVSLPGTASVTSIVVKTDKSVYTREIAGGKDFEFKAESFKNINLDLSKAVREEAVPENIKWYKASVLEDGVKYLIVSQGMALNNEEDGLTGVQVTDNNGLIEFTQAPDASLVWLATAKEIAADNDLIAGHFILENNGQYLQRVSVGNHEYGMGVGDVPSTVKYYAWDYDGEYLFHVSNSSATFYCYYDSGWTTGYQNQKGTSIYTSRTPQELVFSETSVNYNVDEGGDFVEPTLSGNNTTVTYSSSNEAVATVNRTTGEVTVKKAGSAVITATAEGNEEYQAGAASYTIVATSGTVDKFYLAYEILPGESYMVVSGGYAMTTDGSTLGTVPVTGAGEETIQISASEVSFFEAAAHIEYYEGTSPAGHYTLSYGGKYLQRHSEQATQTGAIGAENGKYYVWDYDGEHLYQVSRSGNDGTYCIYYNSGWTFEYQSKPNTYLYSTTKQKLPQRLSFSPGSASAVLGEPFTAPVLSGVKTTVSYTSSDESVATVNTSGEVTLVGLGETTITAIAAADDEYNSGTASYILKVTDGSAPKWYKVDEVEAGETYMIVSEGNALKLDGTSVTTVADAAFTGSSFEYEADDNLKWTAAASSGKFTFKSGGRLLSRNSSNVTTSSSTGSSFSYDGNHMSTAGSSSTYYLYFDGSSWKYITSSKNAALYTMTAPRQAQTLEFSGTSFNFDIASGGSFTAPTLSGNKTPVTYSSSKAAVATVDASTGAVTIVGTGIVTITASTDGDDQYKPASASYTIHVTDSSAPVTTKRYVLASSIEAGKSYIIVSGGYALKNDGGSIASFAVTPVGDALEFGSDQDVSSIVWTAARETSYPANGDFTFENESRYIRRPSGGSGSNLAIEAKPSSWSKYFVFLYDGSHFYQNNMGGSGGSTAYVYWLSYNGGWVFNYVETTDPNHSNATSTQLYVEE